MGRDRRAVIGTAIWDEPSIVALTGAQQHVYLFVYTQGDLNRCGVIAYRPKRWARRVVDLTDADFRRQSEQLHATRHFVLDEDHDELLVRTYVGHDGLLAQPLVVVAMVRDFSTIASPDVQRAILTELRRLWTDVCEPDAGERKGLLLLAGADPEAIGVRAKPEMMERIRGGMGPGLTKQLLEEVTAGRMEPWPVPRGESIPHGVPKGLFKGSGRRPTRERPRMSPSPSPVPTPTPPPPPSPQGRADPPEDRSSGGLADELLDATGPWANGVRAKHHSELVDALDQGFTPEACKTGLVEWRSRANARPGLLPFLIQDAAAHTSPAPNGTRPPWCGECDEATRLLLDEAGDPLRRCPDCHPLEVSGARP